MSTPSISASCSRRNDVGYHLSHQRYWRSKSSTSVTERCAHVTSSRASAAAALDWIRAASVANWLVPSGVSR